KLVESPVLSLSELTEDQAEWWRRNRNREREWFQDKLGLHLELRAEGAAAIDPDGELSDIEFPGGGSAKHLALLLVERVVDELRDAARGGAAADRIWRLAPGELVSRATAEVLAEWGSGLKREYRDNAAVAFADAQALLVAVGL